VKYKSGPKAGQLVAADIEAWFQQDKYAGNPHIVAQWATPIIARRRLG
jgi:K+-transporting ATPase ATPase C chain